MARDEAAIADRQRKIDAAAWRLYGIPEQDRVSILAAFDSPKGAPADPAEDDEESDASPAEAPQDAPALVASLLSYALGCAFGRWDARIGCDTTLAPQLAGPFDPLPVCAPGALVNTQGLPATSGQIVSEEWLRARPDAISLPPDGAVAQPTIPDSDYPLDVAWDGILVDDEGHPRDVVARVRAVLDLLWGGHAESIEREACELLGVKSLRDYFRNPRGFWDDHLKRYSKSRRKAPLYWLLQSRKRSYGVWLYYHRLDSTLLARGLSQCVAPKIQLEEGRLNDQRARKEQAGATGAAARKAESEVARQEELIAELEDFRDKLKRAVDLGLQPDLDDGVVLNAAPLWEVMPWKEPKSYWEELRRGKYAWSSVGTQLQAQGLISSRVTSAAG